MPALSNARVVGHLAQKFLDISVSVDHGMAKPFLDAYPLVHAISSGWPAWYTGSPA